MTVDRQTVDLSGYPDLVVVYLGLRVTRLRGIRRVWGLGPQISASWKAEPDGLLLHEDFAWSVWPPHAGIRQYWRDLESLEAWTRSGAHRDWWTQFLRDTGGTAFWHESYLIRGGFEAVYDDLPSPSGMSRFAPLVPAQGRMMAARDRLRATQPT